MSDAKVLKAVCCLAGSDSGVTVEELQVLDGIAERAGIGQKAFRVLLEKLGADEEFRQEQIDIARGDAAAALRSFADAARADERLGEGGLTMLLWRVATNQLGLSPEQFEGLMAPEA